MDALSDMLRLVKLTGAVYFAADGLTLYWASDRPGGMGDLDVWQARRTSTSAAFGDLAPVSSVNTAGADAPSDVSTDGCRLYLTSTRAGLTGIYVATRL